MSLFDLQDVCIAIGSIATLDLPMVVDMIGIYGLKGPYCMLTTTNWFLQELSVIPRGSWGDVAGRFTMIRWANEGAVHPVVDLIRRSTAAYLLKCRFPCETGRSQAPRRHQAAVFCSSVPEELCVTVEQVVDLCARDVIVQSAVVIVAQRIESTRSVLGKCVYLVTLAMSLFDLQDVCIAIGSIATLDLPMVVDLIGIYVLNGSYFTLTTINWFLRALSVIPRGSWGDVARRSYHDPMGKSGIVIPEPQWLWAHG
ncbi:hypothetical protein F511_26885 [Dorcoceras hygrometricum]|uniref:Acyl-CoA dehydrogenase-related protein n=1 Tax=Dorcoceras hygrometricum TaxID=472368 RepID=A0A2Z7CMG8_9LAMI|nr:hypothetical protein F511_26885 [Dorcoceras hygrometricum]